MTTTPQGAASSGADPLALLLEDLKAEVASLAAVVDGLGSDELRLPTPAVGWTIADQLGHLATFDERGAQAILNPDAFTAAVATARSEGHDVVEAAVEAARSRDVETVPSWWHQASAQMLAAAATLSVDQRLPWYGPDMGAKSFVTARLMETWAHGHDVRDALRIPTVPTDRLRHVIDIGTRARPFSYKVRGMRVPDSPLRVEAIAPDGTEWIWGPEDSPDVVRGSAIDLACLVTQRRNIADLALSVTGANAREWVTIAQAYAGPAGGGRQSGNGGHRPGTQG